MPISKYLGITSSNATLSIDTLFEETFIIFKCLHVFAKESTKNSVYVGYYCS